MQHQKKWTKFKKLSNAAHDLSSLGFDADNSKFLNPLPSSDNQLYNEPLQCVTFIGRIENFETEIIIDSGSGVSIIGLELFTLINKHAKSPLELYTNSILAKTATGEKLDIIGTTTLEVDFGHSNWYVDCYVARNFNYSFLIGTDFLVKSGAKGRSVYATSYYRAR